MDKRLRERFWAEFYVPTQRESKDVAFANPADVANVLVASRNWYGTISEDLVSLEAEISEQKTKLRELRRGVTSLESDVLSECDKVPTTATKNQTTMLAFIRKKANDEQQIALTAGEAVVNGELAILEALEMEKAQTEMMRRAIEKTADWLVQYINWHKFEVRAL